MVTLHLTLRALHLWHAIEDLRLDSAWTKVILQSLSILMSNKQHTPQTQGEVVQIRRSRQRHATQTFAFVRGYHATLVIHILASTPRKSAFMAITMITFYSTAPAKMPWRLHLFLPPFLDRLVCNSFSIFNPGSSEVVSRPIDQPVRTRAKCNLVDSYIVVWFWPKWSILYKRCHSGAIWRALFVIASIFLALAGSKTQGYSRWERRLL